MVLSEVFVDSPMGVGWVDPEGPNQSFTRGDSGAWDLGPAGSIAVTVPLWDVGNETRDVEFAVNVVAFDGFFDLPTFSIVGHEMTGLDLQEQTLESTPPWESWKSRSWSGTLGGIVAEELTFLISAHPSSGSLVDTLELYAIPEPRVYAVVLGLAALVLVALRRRQSGARRLSVARR